VLTVTFMGLTGPSGVLPRHYTELLLRIEREAKHAEKHALRDWFDLFNTRVIGLFYRAWEKYRFHLAFERGDALSADPDTFTEALDCLVGLGVSRLRNRMRVVRRPAVEASRSAWSPASTTSPLLLRGPLRQAPADRGRTGSHPPRLFRRAGRVVQFQGQWLNLPRETQSRIGAPDGHNQMGEDLVAGERVWDVQSKLRVRVGPLAAADFDEFLPDATRRPAASVLSARPFGPALSRPGTDFDVQLLLRARTCRECQFPEATGDGPRLGWDCLGQQPDVRPRRRRGGVCRRSAGAIVARNPVAFVPAAR